MKSQGGTRRVRLDTETKQTARVPNAQTREAMAEIDEMVRARRARFASADEVFADLEEAAARAGTHADLFD